MYLMLTTIYPGMSIPAFFILIYFNAEFCCSQFFSEVLMGLYSLSYLLDVFLDKVMFAGLTFLP